MPAHISTALALLLASSGLPHPAEQQEKHLGESLRASCATANSSRGRRAFFLILPHHQTNFRASCTSRGSLTVLIGRVAARLGFPLVSVKMKLAEVAFCALPGKSKFG